MPLAQNHQLNVPFQKQVGHLGQQVPAFLRIETADLREHRDVGTLGEARLPLEPGLAPGLALADAGRVITGGQHRLVARAPGLGVDPVDDSAQVGPSVTKQLLQSRSQPGGLDLPGVGRAHRAEHVGKHQARLHEAELAVELELPPVEEMPVQDRSAPCPSAGTDPRYARL